MKKDFIYHFLIVAALFLSSVNLNGQISGKDSGADSVAHAKRMQWWNDARFGMFLHWGVYSQFGGEWDGVDHGKEMGEASAEWIYLRADIPREDYQHAAAAFNPVHYDPDDWVRMASDAGMKYMVLTSKHHDGFAMFDTKASSWNIMEASPYKKDIIKMYTDACRAGGMRVGLYFSHERDWFHHEKARVAGGPVSEEYIRITRTHLKELLNNYGKIDIIWFDMGIKQHAEFNRSLYDMVRKYQPECIISSRIGNGMGDYLNLGDRKLAPPGMEGDVESIMTLRLNWGYDKNDSNWKSSSEVISMLSKCACRNSNFLLNMAPRPDGRFSPEEVIRLKNIGLWMKQNSASIYGTSGSPFKGEYPWGSLTSREEKVYLHLYSWDGGTIQANGLRSRIRSASMLHDGSDVSFEQQADAAQLTLSIPDRAKEALIPVVVLEIDSELEIEPDKGPTWIPETIHHINRLEISGVLSRSDESGLWIDTGEKELYFELHEAVKYRINRLGVITSVQGFYPEVGERYSLVYTPGPSPVLEILTEMRP